MFFYFLFALLTCSSSFALEGISSLEKKLYNKNMDYQSQIDNVESKKLTLKSNDSSFYPTLNLTGGWQKNKTDDFSHPEQGYVGYLEGRANIFRGFKDQTQLKLQNVELQISRLDLEIKKQDLRLQLTEIVSDMIYLHQLQNVLQEELKVTKAQRQMAAKKVAAGLTGTVDHLELDLRENEIEIEIKQIDQAHSENHQKLTQLYGYDVVDAELDHVAFSTLDTFAQFNQNLKFEENLNIKKSKWTQNKYQYEKESIQADFMPSFDLTYSFGRLTPTDEKKMDFNESKYGLILTFPLFSGFDTYYKTKAAFQQLKAAEKTEKQFIISSLSEFNILKTKISETLTLYSINERKMKNAQKYFELTLAEYRRGTKNSPDLVGATDRLFSTKKKTFELIKDLEILKTKLETLGTQASSDEIRTQN